jgi:hypothetical protein
MHNKLYHHDTFMCYYILVTCFGRPFTTIIRPILNVACPLCAHIMGSHIACRYLLKLYSPLKLFTITDEILITKCIYAMQVSHMLKTLFETYSLFKKKMFTNHAYNFLDIASQPMPPVYFKWSR